MQSMPRAPATVLFRMYGSHWRRWGRCAKDLRERLIGVSRFEGKLGYLAANGWGSWAMSKANLLPLAACLAALACSGCSLSETAPRDFTLVGQREGKATESGNSLAAAEIACKEQTKRKGIASVLGIVSRLRKGAADEDYIACMKARGYEVTE